MVLRTAVVGAGTVSGAHLIGLDRSPRTELVAICDIDERRARNVANTYGIRPYVDMDTLLDEEELDWVHICTSVQTHLPLGLKAIEAGVPLLIEKPVTETVEECEALEAAAREHDVPVSVVHQHLYDPAMRTATEQIQRGELGEIRGVDVIFTGLTTPDEPNRGSWTFDLPGGEFEEGIPHPIYLGLSVAGYPRDEGSIQSSTSLIGEYEYDFLYDNAQVQYVSQRGTLCAIKMLTGTIPQRLVHIHGERKTLTVDLISQTVEQLHRDYRGSALTRVQNNLDRVVDRLGGVASNAYLVGKRKYDDSWENVKEANPHYYLFDEEARLLEQGRSNSTSLERAKWTMQITESIRASTETGVPVVQR